MSGFKREINETGQDVTDYNRGYKLGYELAQKVLRDEFAMRAMQGIVTALTSPTGLINADEQGVSKVSYQIADAMIEQRKQEEK